MIMWRLQRTGINVQFCWCVDVNEKADNIAKRALKLINEEIMKISFGKCEVKSIIRKTVRDLWMKKWEH